MRQPEIDIRDETTARPSDNHVPSDCMLLKSALLCIASYFVSVEPPKIVLLHTLIQLRPPCGVIRHSSASGASLLALESKVYLAAGASYRLSMYRDHLEAKLNVPSQSR